MLTSYNSSSMDGFLSMRKYLNSMATELPILLFTVRQVKNCQDGLL